MDLSIIIPTLNEEKNLRELLPLLKSLYPKAEMIISDDGSRDRTIRVAEEMGARVIDRKGNAVKGLTASVISAIMSSKKELFVVMDADFQHDPNALGKIVSKLNDGFDLVIGTRKVGKWPLSRKMISWIASGLGYIRLWDFSGKDIMSGFFGCRTDLARKIIMRKGRKFVLPGYKILFELLKYMPKGTRIGQVRYPFSERRFGSSKLSNKQVISYLKSVFRV